MKGSVWIILIIGLVLIIGTVIIMREKAKTTQMAAQAQREANEAALLLGAMNLVQSREQIQADQTTSVGDWLDTIGSVADATASIFSGLDLGLGGNN